MSISREEQFLNRKITFFNLVFKIMLSQQTMV